MRAKDTIVNFIAVLPRQPDGQWLLLFSMFSSLTVEVCLGSHFVW